MNWKPFLSKLQKIKVLAENAETDGQLSKLERDLLASYVRDLYECLYDSPATEPVKKAEKQERIIYQSPPETKAEFVEIAAPVRETVQVVHEKPQAPIEMPKVESNGESRIAEPTTQIKTEAPVAVKVPATSQIDPTLLAEIFTESKVTDLSDKLATQKIQDLTKAMGINEKIFTIQELFNNDNGLFNQSMDKLNRFPDFQAAKAYLSEELIPSLDWTSDKKIKKATTFVKLVRRRYM